MPTQPDIRQSISRDFLDQVLATDPGATGKKVDAVLRSINNEVTPPLRMKQTTVANRVLNIGNITVTNPDTARNRTILPIHGLLPTFTSGTVTLDATGAGNATPNIGNQLTLSMTASQFLKVGVHLTRLGAIDLTKGTAASSLGAATAPLPTGDNYAIGYFVVRTDASNNVQNVLDSDIYQYPGTRTNNVDSALSMTGSAANANLDTVLTTIDGELAKLYEDRNATLTDGGIITYTGTAVQFTQALKLHVNSRVSGGAPLVIDLAATTRSFSADGRMLYAVIDRSAGTATVTADQSSLPSVVAANIEVFLIAKRKDSPDGVSRVYFRNGSAFDIGQSARLGSAGSGSGSGNPTLESLKNEHVDSPYEMFTPNIITTDTNTKFASFSGAAYDLVNKVINFSANAQVATSVQMLDTAEFLSRTLDVGAVDLSMFWNKGTVLQAFAVPDAATSYSNLSASTLSGSAVVTVITPTAHHLVTGSRITVTTSTAIGGISAAAGNLSVTNVSITVLSETSFTFTAGAAAGSSATGVLDTVAVLGFLYEVSRDAGTNWFTIPMARVGTTEVLRGSLTFDTSTTTESVNQTVKSQASQNASTIVTDIAGGVVSLGQGFTLTNTARIKKVVLNLARGSATPVGNLFVSLIKDVGGFPSTSSNDIITQSSAQSITGLALTTSQTNYTFDIPSTMLKSGTVFHVVLTTDAAYKAGYTSSVNNSIKMGYNNSGAVSPFLELLNGSNVWSTPGSFNMTYQLLGRELDLRVRVTSAGSPTYPCGLDGYGVFYNLQDVGIISAPRKTARRTFNSTTDNTSTFTISEFTPDPDLLTCYYVEAGQSFKVPSFTLSGNVVTFATNAFNNGGISATVTLIFDQNNGGAFDNSDTNAQLMSENHLGSTNGAYDRSLAGRGIYLRRPDGTLREITIDNNDNIAIYSV